MSEPDKRLASILFYGVIERRITLDYRIKALSSRPIESIDPDVICALRLGHNMDFLLRNGSSGITAPPRIGRKIAAKIQY